MDMKSSIGSSHKMTKSVVGTLEKHADERGCFLKVFCVKNLNDIEVRSQIVNLCCEFKAMKKSYMQK